jgi:IS4 transposase
VQPGRAARPVPVAIRRIENELTSNGDSSLPIPLRRIKVKRDKGGTITLITNDLERTAVEIAALYKGRWQIERFIAHRHD